GLELRPADGSDRGAADWVLEQGEIIIRDAKVEWQDEVRGAPALTLERLNFVLENHGRHHRFALRAEPSREYASAIDVRGDLVGRTVEQLGEWDARLYAALDEVDLTAWKAWVDYPFEVQSGRGALRLWLAVEDGRPTELAADLSLEDVTARFGNNLPALELAAVYGQFGVRQRAESPGLLAFAHGERIAYDGFARRLALVTRDGAELAPADFTAHWAPAQEGRPENGEFVAREIELAPLVLLGERLPLPERLREALIKSSPEGRFADVRFKWTGEIARPDTFSARGRFADLGMRAHGGAPGFTRLSGQFDVTEKGGGASLNATGTSIRLAGAADEDPIRLDALRARLQWSLQDGAAEVRLDELAAAGPELAATANATYRRSGDGTQTVDIAVRASRMDGRAVRKLIPVLRADTGEWLQRAIVVAPLADVRFRLRGDLDDFPFDDPKKGEFRASGRVTGGVLDYAPGWPQLVGVTADLGFEGRKMTITSPRASTYGIQVAKVTAIIPDLIGPSELHIDGQTEGPLADYLRFIAASPVRGFMDGATDGWTGDGRATLELRLKLPLAMLEKTQVAGSFRFAGGTITTAPGDAPLAQVTGAVEFTESSITSKGLAAQTLGGDITVQLATREGATSATVQGTVDGTQLAGRVGLPFAQSVRGQLPFRFTETKRGDRTTAVFESTLAGVAVELPAPFAKKADESWPLRVERRPLGDPTAPGGAAVRRESMTVSLASLLNAEGILKTESGRTSIESAGVGLGDVGVQLPDRPGVFIAGNVKSLDLDRLLPAVTDSAAKSAASDLAVTALNLRAGTLTVVGRNFHDVTVKAQFSSGGTWQATVDAREMAGEVAWRSEGEGLVTARLKHLAHPDPATDPMPGAASATRLPALNIVADRYTLHGRDLGHLEVDAVNERGGWRLAKLALVAPEGAINATGLWQPPGGTTAEQTDLEVTIRTDDAGKYLARFGHPDTLARGTAELDGRAKWLGPIWTIDFPSLSGEVTLRAEKGQFVKLKPGIGKLLGVLSLQSLPRRITLDFNDIFS
ncbi:MAG: YhdP family protein, partial [Bacteroidota bacterium]